MRRRKLGEFRLSQRDSDTDFVCFFRALIPSDCYTPEGVFVNDAAVVASGFLTAFLQDDLYLIIEVRFIRPLFLN